MQNRTKILKHGKHLYIRLPKAFVEMANLQEGQRISIEYMGGEIRLQPVTPPKYRLKDLLENMTEENLHPAVETIEPVGRELF